MSLQNIINAVFQHPQVKQEQQEAAQKQAQTGQAAPVAVDVNALLTKLAAENPEHLDWQHSIVDLLKLVGHDSSKAAREKLADELHYTGDKKNDVVMNEFLHSAVMKELAEGKKV